MTGLSNDSTVCKYTDRSVMSLCFIQAETVLVVTGYKAKHTGLFRLLQAQQEKKELEENLLSLKNQTSETDSSNQVIGFKPVLNRHCRYDIFNILLESLHVPSYFHALLYTRPTSASPPHPFQKLQKLKFHLLDNGLVTHFSVETFHR